MNKSKAYFASRSLMYFYVFSPSSINTWLNAAYPEASLLGPNTLIEHNTPVLEFNGYEQRPIAALIK